MAKPKWSGAAPVRRPPFFQPPVCWHDPIRKRKHGYTLAQRAALYAMMRDVDWQCPSCGAHGKGTGPRVLVGRKAILGYLTGAPPRGLGIRARTGRSISWLHVNRWRADHNFPVLCGLDGGPHKYHAISLERAIDAWILSRPRNGEQFYVNKYRPWRPRPWTPRIIPPRGAPAALRGNHTRT